MASDRQVLNVGIIGGGFMAGVHSRAARSAGGRLTAIASSTPQKGLTAAEQLGFERAATDALDVISDPVIDVVHICTPNALHASLAHRAIAAGKHVICEKPLATDADSAVELAQAAARAGVVATVPFVYRFHPLVREARALVATNTMGRVTGVHASYLQDWLLESGSQNWRVDPAAGGASRAFGDIGSHLVDMVEFVTGQRIQRLCAVKDTVHTHRSGRPVLTEDLAAVLVTLENGSIGTLMVSQVAAGHDNDLRLEVFGETGSISFAQERPDVLEIGRLGRQERVRRGGPALSADARRLSTVPPGHPMGYQEAFTGFVRDSYAAITGESPEGLPTFQDGARANLLTDAVMSSATAQAWIDVADITHQSSLPIPRTLRTA